MSGREHAVVMGGSVAGLAAAAVLARHFRRVTLFERDPEPLTPDPRRGVPQGTQSHVLLDSGREILSAIFPGLFDELAEAGAVHVDMGYAFRWFQFGAWKAKGDVGYSVFSQTRPFLEFHMLRRVKALPNVTLRFGEAVDTPLHQNGRVIGVRLRGDGAEAIEADLTIDATGRGSRTPKWLESWGYERPVEDEVNIKLGYASRLYRPVESDRDWTTMVVYPMPPAEKRGGCIFPVEDGMWQVTLVGYHGDHPSNADADFQAFAEQLPHPALARALATATPLTETRRHQYPRQVRRRYDKLSRLPDSYGLIGDAFCSLDPVFGQGMSLACKGAKTLDNQLTRSRWSTGAFQRAVKSQADTAWLITASEAHRYKETTGSRPFGVRLLHWYTGRVFELAAVDARIYRVFLSLVHLEKTSIALFALEVVSKVLRPLPAMPAVDTAASPVSAPRADGGISSSGAMPCCTIRADGRTSRRSRP